MNTSDWIPFLECDGLTIDEISHWYVQIWLEGENQLINRNLWASLHSLPTALQGLR